MSKKADEYNPSQTKADDPEWEAVVRGGLKRRGATEETVELIVKKYGLELSTDAHVAASTLWWMYRKDSQAKD